MQVLRATTGRVPLAGRGGRPASHPRATRRRIVVGLLVTCLVMSGCTGGAQTGIPRDEVAQIEEEIDEYLSVSDTSGLLRALRGRPDTRGRRHRPS